MRGICSVQYAMSSSEVIVLNEKRIHEAASSGVSPIAASTCDGSKAPEWQADPAEAQIPTSSRRTSKACASSPRKPMLDVLGRRSHPAPFTNTSGISFASACSN